eukprot:scaffold23150_cov124-Isochrysis_galbana.AAC.2
MIWRRLGPQLFDRQALIAEQEKQNPTPRGILVRGCAGRIPPPPRYAHNILVDPSTGRAKLGDFGAAFYYGLGPHARAYYSWQIDLTPSAAPHARVYEAIEARAYGILLHELLMRHDGMEDA